MYARVTRYQMKPGSKAAATKIMNGLKDQIMAMDGQQSFLNVMDDDTGSGYVISTTTNAVTSPETLEKIAALWGAFAKFIQAPPETKSYEVAADWRA